ncbi:NYN domain-containing protein [Helicobacter saguini]|uniref:NYN domain-containing protein n=1 Tax=Helicobacter saguini TaxID=1548018 RepID=A0A347VSK7_9HELI|nr:NYN domain-containing protein [Helicobacter saguini]MWV62465.1 NYN domain-containing protein [Helicobacter saguini]MWV66862.1 NYN domain-containing protein [Helicobacter saguini]MWV69211.1 NYN domain-containing protein [Helicobacter saguini]MWV71234.1 NYN domain-containing protein [Helicobacter saguini]TLD93297.1 NYN domain-containing protein [Helicobacter saguini]
MSKNLALFIDCDKLEVAFMSVIFDYLKNHGYNVCLKKAYINKDNLINWQPQLDRQYCKIVLGTSQANTNMNISADVANALYSGKYEAIAIASNYKEFGVLASSVREQGLESLCFYQYSKGNEAFLKRAYNVVYNLEPTPAKSTQTASTGDAIEDFGALLENLDMGVLNDIPEDVKPAKSPAKRATKPRTTKVVKSTTKKSVGRKKA